MKDVREKKPERKLNGRKLRIENGAYTITIKNPVLRSENDRGLKTLKVHDRVELMLQASKCISFGVPMDVDEVTLI